jgi:hypothetical protein
MKSTAPQMVHVRSVGGAVSPHATVHPETKTALVANIAVLAVSTP